MVPCKVWDADRTVKKSVAVSSLDDLLKKGIMEKPNKGKGKLSLDDSKSVRIVLEEDGTEVDDDDYFKCLENNTTFMFLLDGEQWKPEGISSTVDETDFAHGRIVCDGVESPNTDQVLRIVELIKGNPAKIITLSTTEMEVLVKSDQGYIARMMNIEPAEAGRILLNCQRHLDDRTKALDAVALLETVERSNKRQRKC